MEVQQLQNLTHTLQGYLAHQKQRPPMTLQKDYVWSPMEAHSL